MEEHISVYLRLVEQTAAIIEGAGIFTMVAGIAVAAIAYFRSNFIGSRDSTYDYHAFRVNIGRAILLSLELLVGADLIETVVMKPTMDHALQLGVIVLIRTVLSMALQIEIKGCLPWEEAKYKQMHRYVSEDRAETR